MSLNKIDNNGQFNKHPILFRSYQFIITIQKER